MEEVKAKGGFQKGNKLGTGRPVGLRNKSTMFIMKLGQDNADALLNKTVELAMMGDTACIKILMDRVYPQPKFQSFVKTDVIKGIHTQTDINKAMTRILDDVGEAELSIEEGIDIQKLVESKGASIQKCYQEELETIRETYELLHKSK